MPTFPRAVMAGAMVLCAHGAGAEPLYVTITGYRSAVASDVNGTDLTVIDSAAIERSRADSVAAVLRTVPGVSLYESGGAGSQTLVMLRGAAPQHTLVLIDGVRVNDPTSTSAQFDFSKIALADVERIEVLKGPQTALYGSDALGGVINIITKRGGKTPAMSASLEGGSYGTAAGTLAMSGGNGPLSLSASGSFFRTDGFSRVGDRDHGEADGSRKFTGRVGGAYDAGGGVKLDFSVDASQLHSEVDGGSTIDSDQYLWDRDFLNGFARVVFAPDDSRFRQSFTTSGFTETARFTEPTRVTDYHSRVGAAEYQGELGLRAADSLIFGARLENQQTELAATTPLTVASNTDLFAGFALYRLEQGRWHLSFGGRYDAELGGDAFLTGRATAAYDIAGGFKLRASVANGANRPTAYQRFHPIYGTAGLETERSIGGDAGFDWNFGRVTLTGTGFYNRFDNLIAFNAAASKYQNIAAAQTYGAELGVRADIIPGVLFGSIAYTWLQTENLSDDPALHGKPLARRPEHSGAISLTYTGIERLEFTTSIVLAGLRFNDDKATVSLPGYARVDLYAAYRLDAQWSAYGRVENLFNADYREIAGYNTPGLSAYAGLKWRH
jgi:vitamin B12 transporter